MEQRRADKEMERQVIYVPDASVVVKWFVQEDHSNTARGFMLRHIAGELTLVVPDLLLYELPNVLKFSAAFLPSPIGLARELGIEFISADEKLQRKVSDLPFFKLLQKFRF